MRWASPRPSWRPPPARASRDSWPPDITAIWAGLPTRPTDAASRRCSGPRRCRWWCKRLTSAAALRSPRRSTRTRSGRDLRLCPQPRLPRHHQEASQDAGVLDGGALRLRGEGLRRYRPGHGEGRWLRRRGSAGRASIPISSLASSAPGSSWARSSPPSISKPGPPRRTIAAPAGAASMPAPPPPSPPPTSSMRGAASPISPSSIKDRSTVLCGR